MIIHQIDGIVKKMFVNRKEIGGCIEAMWPAMEAGPAGVRASVLALASLAATRCRGKPGAAKIISLFY